MNVLGIHDGRGGRRTGVESAEIDHVAVGFEAMVGRPGEGYDYEAEPQLHRKVYSALTRTFGGVMDSKPAIYGSLQVLKLLSRKKAELKANLNDAGVTAPVRFFNHHLTHAASAYVVMRDGTPGIDGPAAADGTIWWAQRDGDRIRIEPPA